MEKKICNRCVMSSESDPTISFDENGICNYCTYALQRRDNVYFPNEQGDKMLTEMIAEIKNNGKNKKYDCLMGISGGLDSAYLAFLGAKKWNLRILAVHVDDGFDTDIAKSNIENLCKNCNIDLINKDLDKKQFGELTASYIRAGVPGICNPQDNALFAVLFETAMENKLNYFLSGTNFALESILQRGNGHPYADKVQINNIFKKFGKGKINNIKLISLFDRYIKFKYIKKLKFFRPLDLIDYNKKRAMEELFNVGFMYYGGKHYESILTRFAQTYYLPTKFNIDKRTSHLSSLIIDNQLTREEALIELTKPLYNELQMNRDIDLILKKINMEREEFDKIMSLPPKAHSCYKSSLFNKFGKIARKYRTKLSD